MSIPALLNGVASYLGTALTATDKVKARPGADGRPGAAYKRGMKWFIGVYFGGCQGGPGVESHERRYTVGIDITWSLVTVPTQLKGTVITDPSDSLLELSNKVFELMLGGRSLVATAMNGVLGGSQTSGAFHENFNTGTISPVKNPDPVSWVLAAENPTAGQEEALDVVSMTFSGIVWRKYLSNLFGG